jgi:acyl-CoA synthetase (NDP forming)
MSSSGGEAILMADAARRHGVGLPEFAPDRRAAVEATVSDLVTVSNPLDYHTFMWGDAAAMAETFTAVMAGELDLTCMVLDLPRADRCDDSLWRPSLAALEAAQQRTGGRAALIASLPDGLPEDVAERCLDQGIAPLVGLDSALAAVAVAIDIGLRWRRPAPPTPLVAEAAHDRSLKTLDEAAGKARIAAAGAPVPDGRTVTSRDGGRAAAEAAQALGFPVAVKALSAELPHKSDVGGVALNLTEPDAAAAAAERMAGLSDRVLVERMVTDALAEVIVGYQYDAKLGGFLLVGSGGELVELVGDSEVLPLPLADGDVSAALDRLRVTRLIDGYRGRPRGDRAALEAAIAGIAQVCVDAVDTLVELDVNPLLVRPEGRGVVAADVLIRHTESEERVSR